jgi:predicted regulator of Ras-like GTPase activity (Roadblock/LC7/MglB family)
MWIIGLKSLRNKENSINVHLMEKMLGEEELGGAEAKGEMHISKKQEFENLLQDLETSVGDIKGLAIVTKNGLPIAIKLPGDVDINTFSGMSAATYGAAETTMLELKHGHVYWVYTEAEDYTLVIVDAGRLATLVALVRSGANTGLVLMKLKDTADKVKNLM